MKNLIIFASLFAMVLTLAAQTYFRPQTYALLNHQADSASVNVLSTIFAGNVSKKHPNVGWNAFALLNQRARFAEVLFGPTYVRSHLQVGIMLGVETGITMWRASPWIYAESKSGRLAMFAAGEYGASGYWFTAEAKASVLKPESKTSLKLVAMARRFHGVGPRIDVSRGALTIFAAPFLWDWQRGGSNCMFGINAKF